MDITPYFLVTNDYYRVNETSLDQTALSDWSGPDPDWTTRLNYPDDPTTPQEQPAFCYVHAWNSEPPLVVLEAACSPDSGRSVLNSCEQVVGILFNHDLSRNDPNGIHWALYQPDDCEDGPLLRYLSFEWKKRPDDANDDTYHLPQPDSVESEVYTDADEHLRSLANGETAPYLL